MEDFAQTNMFAWICIVFAHLIIGCAIRYPIIGKLHYHTVAPTTTHTLTESPVVFMV